MGSSLARNCMQLIAIFFFPEKTKVVNTINRKMPTCDMAFFIKPYDGVVGEGTEYTALER